MELETAMTEILAHSLEITKILREIEKDKKIELSIAINEMYPKKDVEISIYDDYMLRIIGGTKSSNWNFNELNCIIQRKMELEYKHDHSHHRYTKWRK